MQKLANVMAWLRRQGLIGMAVVVFLALGFRSAIADWNDVPTGSMKPTILIGDRIFVVLRYSIQGVAPDTDRNIDLKVMDPDGTPVDFLSVARKLGPDNGTFSATLESILPSSLTPGNYTLITELSGGPQTTRRALRFAIDPAR